jgi:hypothetical protein
MNSPAEPAVGAGNDVVAADDLGEANNAVGNEFRVLQHHWWRG